MRSSLQWQTWRKCHLSAAESIIGPNSSHTSPRPPSVAQPRGWASRTQSRHFTLSRALAIHTGDLEISKEIRARKLELDAANLELYPRYVKDNARYISLRAYISEYEDLGPGESREENAQVVIQGRITAIRTAGARLVFIDIAQEGDQKVQVLLNHGQLEAPGLDRTAFVNYRRLLQRGDIICAKGYPHRTKSKELSLKATELPKTLVPCLQQFPVLEHHSKPAANREVQPLNKHVEMLCHREPVQVLVRRSEVINHIRSFFQSRHFVEVQTPILAASAGGAVARPFQTSATEFGTRKLSLRIAPELWLKRLIVGGMERIFEIGPSFRNEGLDKTHNPEFTTCEFYSTYTTLPELLATTEALLNSICQHLHQSNTIDQSSKSSTGAPLPLPQPRSFFEGPYPQIDFIPALNATLYPHQLPNLTTTLSPTTTPEGSATSSLLEIFAAKSFPLPSNPTLPRLLDKLASLHLEPQCEKPTWIINHPECLSPLSKSFIHPNIQQPVAARAELFVNGREIVNCYEEENSPFEQRRKFRMQQRYADPSVAALTGDLDGSQSSREDPSPPPLRDEEAMPIDEDYLRALEWGLPPTGGWGCGIDRLVMLFTGKERIGDVLSFGNLRAVTRGAEKVDGIDG